MKNFFLQQFYILKLYTKNCFNPMDYDSRITKKLIYNIKYLLSRNLCEIL
jgi:hypothetical protein